MDHAFKSDEDFPDRIDVGFLRDILGWRNRFYDWVDEYEMSPMAGSILLQCYQSKFYTITSLEKLIRMGVNSYRAHNKWLVDNGFVEMYMERFKKDIEVYRQSEAGNYYTIEEKVFERKYRVALKGTLAVLKFVESFDGSLYLPKDDLKDRAVEKTMGKKSKTYGKVDTYHHRKLKKYAKKKRDEKKENPTK